MICYILEIVFLHIHWLVDIFDIQVVSSDSQKEREVLVTITLTLKVRF
jgi:hypothetical protein